MRGYMTDKQILEYEEWLDRAYREAAAFDEARNTGHVQFEYRLWPDDPQKWSQQYPEVFRLLEECIAEGGLLEGGYYIVQTDPLRAKSSGTVRFVEDRDGLCAEVDFRWKWPEPREAASDLASISGLWDENEGTAPTAEMLDKLAEALIERVPGSSDQFLNAPRTTVRLCFGEEPSIETVFSKLNSIEYELSEQNYREWSAVQTFAKDFLSSLK